jgi:predicted DNA-binding transcriptional regulator AlpA
MDANQKIPGTCRLMRIREVLTLCGLSRATLYREIKLHGFPAPIKLSARSVGWLQDDVVHWIESRIAQRDHAYEKIDQLNLLKTRPNNVTTNTSQPPGQDGSE